MRESHTDIYKDLVSITSEKEHIRAKYRVLDIIQKDTQNKEKGKTSEQEQQTQKQKRRHSATRTNLPTQQHTIPVYSTAGVKTSVPGIITPY